MEQQPKKLIIRILEVCALFALSVFLLRLSIIMLKEIWWILLIIAIVVVIAIIAYRIYKNKVQW